jgi:hypothetical protein
MLRTPTKHVRSQPIADQPVLSRWATWWSSRGVLRGDVVAVVILIALPAALFGLPAILGHSVLPGDDLTQNYPLRVLVGRQIGSGHLPLFDPYIWSGAPLLADWNAGAVYPLTLLFAILPGTAAWAMNLIITWAVAAVGMFWFLRCLRLATLPSFLGAFSFAFAGAIPAQVGHFGLVAGMSWVPLELVAILRLSQDRGYASRLGWVCVLAGAFGLTILAGEPRAIDDAALVVVIYAAWQIARLGRRWVPAALSVAGGLVVGVFLGAVQLLPGLAAVATSQRATTSAALFNSGSLAPKWLLLTLVPDLLGGSGSFSQPSFLASYNLAEVTSYVGVLPLIAAVVLLGRIRLRSRPPEWLVWHVMAIVGALFALGGNTPLGHLLLHLPLFGDQRLQSRSILVTDLALAVLLAYWADQPFAVGDRLARLRRRWHPDRETVLGILPPLAMIVIVVVGLAADASLLGWLGVTKGAVSAGSMLRPWLVPYALIGAAAIALVLIGRRLEPRLRTRVLAGFVVADVVVFALLAVVAVLPGAGRKPVSTMAAGVRATISHGLAKPDTTAAAGSTPPTRPISALGYGGRFAIYDPGLLDGGQLLQLGSTDLNVVSSTPSVQGYSSLVNGRYASATGSHHALGDGQDVLSASAVGDGQLAQLNTRILLTLPNYLVTARRGGGPAAGPAGTGRREVSADQRATWYLAAPLAIAEIEVPDSDARQDAASGTQIGLRTPAGAVHWFRARAVNASTLEISLRHPLTSVALIGRAGGKPSPLGPPTIVVPGRGVFVANGQLQNALKPPQWGFAGRDGSFAIFVDYQAQGVLTLQPLPGGSTVGASISSVSGPADDPVTATVSSRHGIRLVRSVAAIPGWSATWDPRSGPAVPLAIHRDGLIQAVDVPAGQGVVTWSYTPPWFMPGATLSLCAICFIVFLLIVRRTRYARPPLRRLAGAEPAERTRVPADELAPAHAAVAEPQQSLRMSALTRVG